MSSEPIEGRVSYISDRLRGSRCPICGKKYAKPRYYCPNCGRKSMGKMEETDYFYREGRLEACTIVNDATNKFKILQPFIYGIISIDDITIPARLTDQIIEGKFNPEEYEGRKVVFRFRRRYSVEPHEIIPTTSHTFTFSDEYYPYIPYEKKKPQEYSDKPGIVGYALYTSRFRIKEGNRERAVPYLDEDAITAAVEAGKLALIQASLDSQHIGKVYVGTESNPYAVKPIASKVVQTLNIGKNLGDGVRGADAIDTEFACKAATSMFKDAVSLVYYPKSNVEYAMVIGADNSQAAPRGEPGGELDFFVGYGACAFIFGMKDVIAEIEGWYSVTSDTPDFWRRDQEPYPRHGGRFTGDPAYFKHIRKAARKLMDKFRLEPKDIDYFVSHQPNINFPTKVAKSLGFREEQFLPSLQVAKFGNTYSGASPIGLAAVLDKAKPHQRILLVSYGSGAGSDAYLFVTTSQIKDKSQRQRFTVEYQAENPFIEYVDYATYRKLKRGLEA